MSAFLPGGAPGPDIHTETLPGGTRVFTTAAHRIGTDALLLARFCPVKPGFSVCDLGTGCGVVVLALLDRGLAGDALALELDPEGAALVEKAAAENDFSRLRSVQRDLRLYRHAGRAFDLVVANPPYYRAGPPPPDARRAAARHEGSLSLAELCAAAGRLAKERGRFCLCYPPDRLAGLFAALEAHRFAPKRLQLVRKSPGDTPWLALLEARKGGGEGLAVLPDLLLEAGRPVAY